MGLGQLARVTAPQHADLRIRQMKPWWEQESDKVREVGVGAGGTCCASQAFMHLLKGLVRAQR